MNQKWKSIGQNNSFSLKGNEKSLSKKKISKFEEEYFDEIQRNKQVLGNVILNYFVQ